jgi:Clostripain family
VKKLVSYVLIICFLLSVITVPFSYVSASTLTSTLPKQSDYTIMIYMVGSDLSEQSSPDGHTAAEKNIEEMERGVTSSPNVKVLLETGGGSGLVPVDSGSTSIDFRNVQRHQIVNHRLQTLDYLGLQNMGDSKTLSDFIVWGMSQYPAKKYALIFWDHGSGINGFGNDVVFHDILNLDKLHKALLDANQITGKSFEIIGFDACLMASIEVADKIMPFGKYMVASEDITPADGWNYSAVLSNLTKYPNQDGLSASKTIANSFAKHSTNPIDIQGITISVISLEKIAQAIKDVNNLSSHLLTTITDVPSSLLMATAADSTSKFGVVGTNRSGQVDLSGLLFHIREKFPVLGNLVDNSKIIKKCIII